MSRPVRAHLVLGCEYLATASLTGEVPLLMDIRVVELLHVLRSENFTTLSTGEAFTLGYNLLLSSGIGRASLPANIFGAFTFRNLHTAGLLPDTSWLRSFVFLVGLLP